MYDTVVSRLKAVFDVNGIKYDKDAGTGDRVTSFHSAISALVPERVWDYDPECIDAPEDYIRVLLEHAKASNGVFAPRKVHADQVDGQVSLTFQHGGVEQSISFGAGSGDYVSEHFVRALNAYCEPHLSLTFMPIPARESGYVGVCLPKYVAAAVNEAFFGDYDTGKLIDFILGGGEVYELPWHLIAFEIQNGYDRNGETICTALVNNRSNTTAEVLEVLLNESDVDFTKPNANGYTPLGLARESGDEALISMLEMILGGNAQPLGEIEDRTRFVPDSVSQLVGRAEECLEHLFVCFHFISRSASNAYQDLQVSRTRKFFDGEDVLNIRANQDGETGEFNAFRVRYQKSGAQEKSFDRVVGLDEAAAIICKYAGVRS